jgi:hypothetical protein
MAALVREAAPASPGGAAWTLVGLTNWLTRARSRQATKTAEEIRMSRIANPKLLEFCRLVGSSVRPEHRSDWSLPVISSQQPAASSQQPVASSQ